MKMKTIEAITSEEIDRLCNEFESQHKVKFTQTNFFIHDRTKHYIYVLFYEDENIQQHNYGIENQPRDMLVNPQTGVPLHRENTIGIIQPNKNIEGDL